MVLSIILNNNFTNWAEVSNDINYFFKFSKRVMLKGITTTLATIITLIDTMISTIPGIILKTPNFLINPVLDDLSTITTP